MPKNQIIQKTSRKETETKIIFEQIMEVEKDTESSATGMFTAKEKWTHHCKRHESDHKRKEINLESDPKQNCYQVENIEKTTRRNYQKKETKLRKKEINERI